MHFNSAIDQHNVPYSSASTARLIADCLCNYVHTEQVLVNIVYVSNIYSVMEENQIQLLTYALAKYQISPQCISSQVEVWENKYSSQNFFQASKSTNICSRSWKSKEERIRHLSMMMDSRSILLGQRYKSKFVIRLMGCPKGKTFVKGDKALSRLLKLFLNSHEQSQLQELPSR